MDEKNMQEQINELKAQFNDLLNAIHDAAMLASDTRSAADALQDVETEYRRRRVDRIRAQKPKSREAMMRNRANRIRINRSDFV